MKILDWFTRKSHKQGCKTDELTQFIQEFVTEESLEPAVAQFISKDNCDCGCKHHNDDGREMELDMDYMPLEAPQPVYSRISRTLSKKPLINISELEVLLAGHKAWCIQVEQFMRENKTSEYNMANVGSSLMCCIGQWLQCEGTSLSQYPEYQRLVDAHTKFHQCTDKMLTDHRRGQFIAAVGTLRGEFVTTSTAVQDALQALMHRIRGETAAQNDEHMRQIM